MKILLFFAGFISMAFSAPPEMPQILGTCTYACSGTLKPFPIPGYVKTANGCGSKGIHVDAKLLPKAGIENCCNSHDFCYETCNKAKAICDSEFRTCMLNVCGTGKDLRSTTCRATAETFYGIVKNAGCSSYKDAQKKACVCR